MAYDTGSASSTANLKSAIEAFAVSNGWTLASGVLSKGSCHFRLTTPQAWSVLIEAANNSAFSLELCPQAQQLIVPTASLPCTYFLFAHGSPDSIVCVINYGVVYFQWLAFGQIQKYGSWTGGNWFGASHSALLGEANHNHVWLERTQSGYGPFGLGSSAYNGSSGAMFWNSKNAESFGGTYNGSRSTHMHIRVDGNIWPGANVANSTIFPDHIKYINPIHSRSPNLWNSQAVLMPMRIGLPRTDGYASMLGHIEHVRALRIDNLDPGQVITIGAEKWKVFPWFRKDSEYPAAGVRSGYTGGYGFACRYDGP